MVESRGANMPQQKDIVKIAIQMPGAYPQLIQLDQVMHTHTVSSARAGCSGSEPPWELLPLVEPGSTSSPAVSFAGLGKPKDCYSGHNPLGNMQIFGISCCEFNGSDTRAWMLAQDVFHELPDAGQTKMCTIGHKKSFTHSQQNTTCLLHTRALFIIKLLHKVISDHKAACLNLCSCLHTATTHQQNLTIYILLEVLDRNK